MKNLFKCFNADARKRALHIEILENRYVLASNAFGANEAPMPSWFSSFEYTADSAMRAEGQPTHEIRLNPFVGPRASVQTDWIVRLNLQFTSENATIIDIGSLLSANGIQFETVRGLGVPGLLQVRAFATTFPGANSALASHENVASFEPNELLSGERIPNDSDFGNLVGLHNVGQFGALTDSDIDAVEAWNQSIGSPTVVVGVVDSGIDVTHHDLYLNVWPSYGPNYLKPQ